MSTVWTFNPMRDLFGKCLQRWYRENGWPQGISQGWAKAGNRPGPWASQISGAMQGRLDPKPQFFASLAEFNRTVAERDLLWLEDISLRNRLLQSQPFCDDHGKPYDAVDFFALFIGEKEPPSKYAKEPEQEITSEFVEFWCDQMRDIFRDLALDRMQDRRELWAEVQKGLERHEMAPDDIETMRAVFSFGREGAPSVEALRIALAGRYRDTKPVVNTLLELGADPVRLGKFVSESSPARSRELLQNALEQLSLR